MLRVCVCLRLPLLPAWLLPHVYRHRRRHRHSCASVAAHGNGYGDNRGLWQVAAACGPFEAGGDVSSLPRHKLRQHVLAPRYRGGEAAHCHPRVNQVWRGKGTGRQTDTQIHTDTTGAHAPCLLSVLLCYCFRFAKPLVLDLMDVDGTSLLEDRLNAV